MSAEFIYEVASDERAERIVDALTDEGFRVYPAPSPEVRKVRVHVDASDELRQAVDEIVARHDTEAVAIR